MRRFYLSILLLKLVLCSLVCLKFNVRADPRIIEVPIDFPSIQAAINNASDGETVFAYNGTYFENIVVNKSISLVGQDESITKIDGGGFGTVVQVTADNVSIEGFTLQDSGSSGAGISVSSYNVSIERNIVSNNYFGILTNVAEVMISNCDIFANYVGIHFESSQSNTVEDSNVTGNDYAGLELSYSNSNDVLNNTISENGVYGVYLQHSSRNWLNGNLVVNHENGLVLSYSGNNTLMNNSVESSRYNFAVEARYLHEFIQDIDFSNTVNDKPICYLVNQNDVMINSSYVDAGYLALVNSSNIQVEGLNLSNNGEGLLIAYTRGSVLKTNVISDNGEGVFLFHATNCSVENNTIKNCGEGALFSFSTDCLLSHNEVSGNNGSGVRILSSQNIYVFTNNIVTNNQSGIHAAGSQELTAHGNNVTYNGAGVFFNLCDDFTLTDNVILANEGDGVYLTYSDDCIIEDNDITSNSGYGVFGSNSISTLLDANSVVENYEEGLYLYQCDHINISGNIFNGNLVGVRIHYSANCTLNYNDIMNNSMIGARFYYSSRGKAFANFIGGNGLEGLSFLYSDDGIVKENSFSENLHYGVWLMDSSNVLVNANNATSNGWDGIYLQYSDSCIISHNSAKGNAQAGINLLSSNQAILFNNEVATNKDGLRIFTCCNATISSNTAVVNSGYGVYLALSSNNQVFHNNFLNNTENVRVFEAFDNSWDQGYPSGGNFWSDYSREDFYQGSNQNLAGSDGIGDSPYVIDDQNIDWYPLMSSSRIHDVGIANVETIANEVYVGWIDYFNVMIRNNGDFIEDCTLTLYCNDTLFSSEEVNDLAVRAEVTQSFVWNTSDLEHCSLHSIKIEATMSLEDANTSDNKWILIVKVKMIGDVDGNGLINILDISSIARAFGAHVGEDRYKLYCDLNQDEIINIVDISAAARNFALSC